MRAERLVGFLKEMAIHPQLREDVAQLQDVLKTVLGKVEGKEYAPFPQHLRDSARILLDKWEVIGWGARRQW